MPLAGGRGIQADLNGEMDSLSLRIKNDFREEPVRDVTASPFNLATSRAGANLGSANNYTVRFFPLGTLINQVLVARISMKVAYFRTVDTTRNVTLTTALYELKDDNSLQRMDETVSQTILSGATTVFNTWYHDNLTDDRKFILYPGKKYFVGIDQAKLSGSGSSSRFLYVYGDYSFTNGVLKAIDTTKTIDGTKIFESSHLTYNTQDAGTANEIFDISFPNIIYSSQEAKSIFKWQ